MTLIQIDSIQQITDSTTAIVTRPMVLKDTIVEVRHSWSLIDSTKESIQTWLTQDSARIAESLARHLPIPRGFVGVVHPSLPQTELWVFLVLIVLFFVAAFSISQSSGLAAEFSKPFFQITDRSSLFSKKTITDIRFRFFLIIFSIGVISLFAYAQMYNPAVEFTVYKYAWFFGVTALYFGLKSFSMDLIGAVFVDSKSLRIAKESYANIVTFLGMCLFPLLLFQIYAQQHYHIIVGFTGVLCCITATILVIIKLFQLFFHKLVASFYILLYLCTLEILPLIVLYWVYKNL